MKKRVIVTGSSGFIGRYVTERLAKEGCSVFAIDKNDCLWTERGVTPVIIDIKDKDLFSDIVGAVGRADVVVHLAAETNIPGNNETIGNNVGSLLSIIELAKAVGAKHFIYMSSIPVIGKIVNTPITEAHPVRPNTFYHWSKFLGEQVLENSSDDFEFATVLRISSPIGPGMKRDTFLSTLINRMKKNEVVEVFGRGNRLQNYVDVRDVSDAVVKAIENETGGLFLLAGKATVSNLELAKLCKEFFASDSVINVGKYDDDEDNDRWLISSEKAEKSFGYKPQFDIRDTLQWIKDEISV